MRVLFHIDESSRWSIALGNAENMLRYGAEHMCAPKIEFVVNGPAVTALQPDTAERLGIAAPLGSPAASVRICACHNALLANAIPPEKLFPFVQIVPAGVVELAVRQAEGYAYIKPRPFICPPVEPEPRKVFCRSRDHQSHKHILYRKRGRSHAIQF